MFSKKDTQRILSIFGMIALIGILAYSVGLIKPSKPAQGSSMLKYKSFETQNPTFDFTFEYPATGWFPEESQGRVEKYDVVYLRGPVDKNKKSGTLICVTIRPIGVEKIAPVLLKAYLKIDSNLDEFKVLRKEILKIGAREASAALCKYKTIPSDRIKDPLVLFMKRMIFLVKDNRSYELTLITSAQQYDVCAPAFEHMLKTFKFKK